ncbi:glycosyltransferase involved in cell wall biosynthesis [Motilibacter rhizosphaerae]|uniref:Glycosyltransferase involved in cell wall biosynthesis n=1 Tax=Motilibacter rhizosphaerae TaxID=598652 RepID=A0A4Q7NQ90_9ACTN|nr:glycosyltransferase family 4 protein [Motilibacter rhizosphaerae]RZS87373.1 glycosyltransferase involved in cell wall biosynthesis [Motilibacter rhizosphaerae]
MRIVLATPAAEAGGVWKHVLDLAAGFQQRGHQVTVALPPGAEPRMTEAADRLGLRAAPLQESRSLQADVWHLHLPKSLEWGALKWMAGARRVRGRATIVTEHLPRVPATDPTLPWDPGVVLGRAKPGAALAKTALKKAMLLPADRVIAVSEHSRRFLLSRYGLRPERVVAVPNGVVPPEVVEPVPDPEGVLRVLSVGALHFRKGYDVLLDAAALSSGTWSVSVIGEGREMEAIRARAAELPRTSVDLLGWRPDAARAAEAAHVLCLPSRSEAMPYSVLEAMACGRAVVASAVDGVPELVEDGVTGLLVPPDDPSALAAALDRLDKDRAAVLEMGAAGRARLLSRFTLETMLESTLRVYESA